MILQKHETIAFDASLKSHRDAVAAFMKRTAWSDTPFRFSHDAAYGSIADQVKNKLLQWYVAQESPSRPLYITL